ncbi:MAG: ATP-binding cassette subfamily F protein uup [Flavobacteriales bacterium]|jgi:ATP-binding cassette subfamily F protein uup
MAGRKKGAFGQSKKMNYLSVENISKNYAEKVLFEQISFGIDQGQKIAFIC